MVILLMMLAAGCATSDVDQSARVEEPDVSNSDALGPGAPELEAGESSRAAIDEPGGEGGSSGDGSTDSPSAADEVTADGSSEIEAGGSDNAVSGGTTADPWTANKGLARTLNIGAVFEVGRYETWALDFEPAHLDAIADRGFTAIRLPVRWSDWASPSPPYEIEEPFFLKIDRVIERAFANDLAVVLDVHHYEELDADPEGERERFLGLWSQIADRYRDLPNSVVFELTNEPHDQLGGGLLNELLRDAIDVIRVSNPERTLMVGPGSWYSPLELDALVVDDDNVIVSIHYYEPFAFTHQGAVWVEGASEWVGTEFDELEDGPLIEREFADIAAWAGANDVPIFVGEFGALIEADTEDRVAWTMLIRRLSERYEFSWGYWDWASSPFGLYEIEPDRPLGGQWDDGLLDALLGSS